MQTELLEVAAARKAAAIRLHKDQADGVSRAFGVGLGNDDHHVARLSVGDIGLLTANDVLVAIAPRRRADSAHVTAGAGLGDAKRAHNLPGDHAGKPAALEFFAREAFDVGGHHVRMDIEAWARDTGTGQLFDYHAVVE